MDLKRLHHNVFHGLYVLSLGGSGKQIVKGKTNLSSYNIICLTFSYSVF
jgi:hypothetical protein